MPRKISGMDSKRRKGKDKAREHYDKCGVYDGKATRRVTQFLTRASEEGQSTPGLRTKR